MSGELAERVLAASQATATVVLVTHTSSVNVRWAANEGTTNGDTETGEVTCIAIQDGPSGPQAAGLTRPAADLDVRALAQDAAAAARAAGPSWDAAPLVAGAPAAPDWAQAAGRTAAADLAATVAALGAEMAQDRAQGREHFGYLEAARATTWLASSAGLRLRHEQPAARLEFTVKSHGRTRSTWAGYAGADLAGADVAAMAAQARTELGWQARDAELAPGRHRALLTPAATADLMVDLVWAADARSALEGRSVFARPGGGTRIGEQLSQRPLLLRSDPAMPHQRSAPFLAASSSSDWASVYDNGLPAAPTSWIADGRLAALVAPRALAAAHGLPAALPPENLALDAGGSGTLGQLLARTDDAVLITCFWYNRLVDPQTHLLTGLTRDGVYRVRGGEVVGRVPNFRFNDSPVAVLGRISDAGDPVPALPREMGDYFTRTTMPPLVVEAIHLSSRSEAV
jgi:predicted Zn-dependent protease